MDNSNLEKNIEQINKIANSIENNDISNVDEMMDKFKKATNLIKESEDILKEYEKKMQNISNSSTVNKTKTINLKKNIDEIESINNKICDENLEINEVINLYEKATNLIKESEETLKFAQGKLKTIEVENDT